MSKACRMLNLEEDGSSTPNTAILKLGMYILVFANFFKLIVETYFQTIIIIFNFVK